MFRRWWNVSRFLQIWHILKNLKLLWNKIYKFGNLSILSKYQESQMWSMQNMALSSIWNNHFLLKWIKIINHSILKLKRFVYFMLKLYSLIICYKNYYFLEFNIDLKQEIWIMRNSSNLKKMWWINKYQNKIFRSR